MVHVQHFIGSCCATPYDPRHKKTCLLGFQSDPTQTRLYSYRRWLEASNCRLFYYLSSENKGTDPVPLFSYMQKAGFLVSLLIFK